LRHGQYVMEAEDPNYGKLTTMGRRQARRLGRMFAGRSSGRPIDAIHHSDWTRAQQTAALLGAALPEVPLHESALLREGDPGVQGRRRTKAQTTTRDRMDEAFAQFVRPCRGRDQRSLVVCHGNLIRYFVMRALDVPTGGWLRLVVAHCSITTFVVLPTDLRVRCVNELGHLPEQQRTLC
ncbi:MAG: histidine phosphatase family protein, partial [Nannocystaceae bacterium]|nr:histidine phosphatase family protein [Nannocystaceae bacterium]